MTPRLKKKRPIYKPQTHFNIMALKTIKSVDTMSMAKLYGALMAAVGFIVSALIALFYGVIFGGMGMLGMMAGGSNAATGIVVMVIGIVMLVVMVAAITLMYGIIGFITGAVGAYLYNLAAGRIGGIKIELE